jgi:hypothetical protein
VTRDYGTVRRLGAAHLIGGIAVAVAAAGFLGFNFLTERHKNVSVAQAWDLKGPPCPTITAETFAAQYKRARQVFDYDGIAIGRHSGNVSCSDVKQKGGKGLMVDRICQFTGPTVITVTSSRGAFYFVPGVGHPATISIHEGQARCVLASNYTINSD